MIPPAFIAERSGALLKWAWVLTAYVAKAYARGCEVVGAGAHIQRAMVRDAPVAGNDRLAPACAKVMSRHQFVHQATADRDTSSYPTK